MLFRAAIVAVCLAGCSVGAAEDPVDGRLLLKAGRDFEREVRRERLSPNESFGAGWFVGVSFGIGLMLPNTPQDATAEQFGLIVLKFLRDHPERLHEHPQTLVIAAIRDAFPPKP